MEKKLAMLALLLGLFAAVVGNPNKKSIDSSNEFNEVELNSELFHFVDVRDLAEWIMTKKNDFILIDIRLKTRFEEYHIPYAKHIQYDSLADDIYANQMKVVYYWQNEKFPHLAWFSLKDSDENNIYILKGGMNEWITRILFPDGNEIEAMNPEQIDRVIMTSRFFGGKPKLKNLNRKKSSRWYLREGC